MTPQEISNTITCVDMIFTAASIICAVCAFMSAKTAKENLSQIIRIGDMFSLQTFVQKFDIISRKYCFDARRARWFQGKNESYVNEVISPMTNILQDFSKVYSELHCDKSTIDGLKSLVKKVQTSITRYQSLTVDEKNTEIQNISDIAEILYKLKNSEEILTLDSTIQN